MDSINSLIVRFKQGVLPNISRVTTILTLLLLVMSSPLETYAREQPSGIFLPGAMNLAGGIAADENEPAGMPIKSREPSPFIGEWQAIDLDGSDLRLAIAGPPNGPFQITWIDNYISFCNGEAGIIRGTGLLSEVDSNLIEVDVHLVCFKTGATLDFHVTLRYHPATNTLSITYWFGQVTIWHRPGQPQPAPEALGLRVNYGHDWVESFYEAGHSVWITVMESDGTTVKATATLLTEPKDFWDGEPGFQTTPADWVPAPPDIQPYDWVFSWVDNGASAQVQIGDINGVIDLGRDSIQGTITAPWFSEEVIVECHPWGAPQQTEMKFDLVLPDGSDPYACGWASEWDIQPYQDVGVGYDGHDGHWVATAITPPNPRIVASETGDWFWVTEFYPGLLDLFIYESVDEGAKLLWSGQQEAADLWGITSVEYDFHGLDLLPGNYLLVSDGVNEKGLVLETISIEIFDTDNEIMAGTAPAGWDVTVVAGMAEAETQSILYLTTDPVSGAWLADFSTIPFDITEEMRPWSFAQIYDEDGDANEAGAPPPPPFPRITVFPEWEWFDGLDWPDGATVTISVKGKSECGVTKESWGGFFNGSFGVGCDLVIGDMVTFTDGVTTRTHEVRRLEITVVDKGEDTVRGTADPGALVYVWPHDGWFEPFQVIADNLGNWQVDLDDVGYDLLEGNAGRSEIRDEVGNATAVDWYVPNPRLVASITEDWFFLVDFPLMADISFSVYEIQGGDPVWEGSGVTDGSGFLWVDPEGENPWNLEPDNYLVVSGGMVTKELALEAFTFDQIILPQGLLEGTAFPVGRRVWVGIGFAADVWSLEVTSGSRGMWIADFDTPVPGDYQWVAAQIFDGDGDASELRPAKIVEEQP